MAKLFVLMMAWIALVTTVACDDREDDDPGATATSEVSGRLRNLANDVADRLDDAADDLDDFSREQADNVQRRCDELSDESEDSDVRDRLGALCEQLARGIRATDGDALERIADELREFAEE